MMIDILKRIDENVEKPFVTSTFGDNWKEHAKDNYDQGTVLDIAWKQGRRAILLEKELKRLTGLIYRP